MSQTKNKERPNQPAFDVGDEFICKLDGTRGYIILPFRAAIIKIDGQKDPRVVPVENLLLEKAFEIVSYTKQDKVSYRKGDKVRIIPTKEKVITGTVLDSRWFYVCHLYKGGTIKVAPGDILLPGDTKIIPPVHLPKINLKDLSGRGRLFRDN